MKLYPWDSWLARDRIVLRRGKDYQCSQSVMAQQIRNAAVQRGLRVSLEDRLDSFLIHIRSLDPAKAKP